MDSELPDSEVKRLEELHRKGLSLYDIAKKIDEPVKSVRQYFLDNELFEDEQLALQSKAFEMFDEGKTPVDLVKGGLCTAEEAGALLEKYTELTEKDLSEQDLKDLHNKLATQIGLLGSRIARIEIQVMNSLMLPKEIECPSCGHEGKYAVGVVCKRCGNVTAQTPQGFPGDALDSVEILSSDSLPIQGSEKEEKEEKED